MVWLYKLSSSSCIYCVVEPEQQQPQESHGLQELERQEKSFHLCSNYFCRLNEHNFFECCSLFLEDSKVSAEEN